MSDRPAPPCLDLAHTALFADLDGTLTPIRPRPEDVGPDPQRTALLDRLGHGLGGAIAIVSGRALEDLDRVLEGGVSAIAAVHGLVRRRATGERIDAAVDPLPETARRAVKAFAGAHPALRTEDKGVALTLHYRAAPDLGDACRALADRLAREHGLTVQRGDMVVELRAPGPTKAEATLAFMAEPPFAGRVPVFVGDDLTDEDGFAAAQRLGGFGVVVGQRRPSIARYALANPAGVLGWLSDSLSDASAP
jgi:trehalose 6-phosphate phosphatase